MPLDCGSLFSSSSLKWRAFFECVLCDVLMQKLGVCPGALRLLLGVEQCSWGPAFWCKNMETATRCNVSILHTRSTT